MTRRKANWATCEDGHPWDRSNDASAAEHLARHNGAPFTPQKIEEEGSRPPSGAKVLLDLFAKDRAVVIRDQFGEGYAKFRDGRVLYLSTSSVGAALTNLYMQWQEGNPPPKGSIPEVVDVLRARVEEAPREPVYLRFGPLPDEGGFAIDLGTNDFDAIVIRPGEWSIERHPVNFRRTKPMGELPAPLRGQDATALPAILRLLLNIADEDEARLVVAFLVSIMKPAGSYLGLGLTGPAGAAKTFAARILRRLIDPVSQEGGGGVKALPRNQDAFSAIVTSHAIPVFDNLSTANPEQSDWLAQVMTGYSDEKRTLYTDTGSTERAARAPVLLTGIDITDRSDLMSRLLVVELSPMPSYATEELVWERFEQAHPAILGAICDVVADAYVRLPSIRKDGFKVRMADMVRFVTAAEPALGWDVGWTEQALADSQGEAVAHILEQQSWYPPLVALLDAHGGTFTGSSTALLEELRERYAKQQALASGRQAPDHSDYPRTTDLTWPKDAARLSSALKRHVGGLKEVGIDAAPAGRSHGGKKSLVIERVAT